MSYVSIDARGARTLGQVLQETAGRVDGTRRSICAALDLADLASQVPAQLAWVHDGFTALAAGVTGKAALAERHVLVDPKGTAVGLGASVDKLGAAISGLLGFAGPADRRAVLVGLAAPSTDPALARLSPVLLPAFQAGTRPELTEAQAADLKPLALELGVEHGGPSVAPVASSTGGFVGRFWADEPAPLLNLVGAPTVSIDDNQPADDAPLGDVGTVVRGVGRFGIALPAGATTVGDLGDFPIVLTADRSGTAIQPEYNRPTLGDAIPATGPLDAARWWGSLTPDLQQRYVSEYPQLIGSLGGIPVVDRHRANVLALDQIIQAQEDSINAALATPLIPMDPGVRAARDHMLAEQTARLNHLTTLRDRMEASYQGPEAERLYLLDIGNSRDGHATVSVGNPDTARYVGVMAPGIWVHFDGLLNDWLPRAAALRAEAERLDTPTPGEPGGVATLVYLYDTPNGLVEPARPEHAEAAAPGLRHIIDGLRVSSYLDPSIYGLAIEGVTPPQGGTRIGVFPHSYGSLIILPAAAQGGLDNANFVYTLAAPGMGVSHRLLLPFQGEVFSAANPNDPVSWFIGPPFHGRPPHTPEWGGLPVLVDPNDYRLFPDLTLGEHSRLWEPHSLRQQALALLGRTDEMTFLSDPISPFSALGPVATLSGEPRPTVMPPFNMTFSHYTLDTLAEPGRPVYTLAVPESGEPRYVPDTLAPRHFPNTLSQHGYWHVPGMPNAIDLPGAQGPLLPWYLPNASGLTGEPFQWHLLGDFRPSNQNQGPPDEILRMPPPRPPSELSPEVPAETDPGDILLGRQRRSDMPEVPAGISPANIEAESGAIDLTLGAAATFEGLEHVTLTENLLNRLGYPGLDANTESLGTAGGPEYADLPSFTGAIDVGSYVNEHLSDFRSADYGGDVAVDVAYDSYSYEATGYAG